MRRSRKSSRPSRRGSYRFSLEQWSHSKDRGPIGWKQDLCEALVAVPANGSSGDAASGSLSQVVMMQTADQWHLDHLSTLRRLHRPRNWTVVRERSVRTYFMVILEVGFENLSQLPFIEHDHLIQAFTPNRTHEPFHVGALPRRPRGD